MSETTVPFCLNLPHKLCPLGHGCDYTADGCVRRENEGHKMPTADEKCQED